MNRYVKILITVILLSWLIVYQGSCSENFTGDFLQLGSGARLLGMGSAAAASSDDATSSYYNPAGLTHVTSREINLMHSEQFGGLENYNSLSVAAPLTDKVFGGITLLHLGVGDIKYTQVWDPSKAPGDSNRVEIASTEDAADYTLFLSAAGHVTDKLDLGSSVKIIRRSIGDDTAFGFGIDLGVRYAATSRITVGANLRDITGTMIAWDGHANDRIALTMDIGAAYEDELPLIGGRYVLSTSMLYFGDSPDGKSFETLNVGIEYLLNDFIAFRAGSTQGNGTFGIGLMRLPLISSSSLDYAFLSHEDFDSTHRMSLSVKF